MNYNLPEQQKSTYDQQQSTQNSSLFPQYQYKNQYSPQKSQSNLGSTANDINGGINTTYMNTTQQYHLGASPQISIVSEVKSPTNGIHSIGQGGIPNLTLGMGSNSQRLSSEQNSLNYTYNSPYQQQKENNRYGSNNQEQNIYNLSTGYGFQSNSPSMQGINTPLNSYQPGIQQTSQQNSTNNITNFINNNANIGNNSNNNQLNQNQFYTNTNLGQQFSGSSQLFSSQTQQDQQQLNMQNINQKTSIEFAPSISHFNQQFNSIGMQQYYPPPLTNQFSETSSQIQSITNIQQNSQSHSYKQSQVYNDSKNLGGIMSMESIQSGFPSNTHLRQSQIPKIIPSNDNLSAIAIQDVSGITNFNYSNFQDFAISSYNGTQSKIPNNQSPTNNIDALVNVIQQNNINERNNLQTKQTQGSDNQTYFSPLPSVSNKGEFGSKITSLTANNTPYKSDPQSISTNTGFNNKSDIKSGGGLQTPSSDMKLKSSLSKAQSPGRGGQILTKNENYQIEQIKLTQEINNFEKQAQNQQDNKGGSIQQTEINYASGNIKGSAVDQAQLLPSQKQLVQSIIVQRNRSQSPKNLKMSNNLGQASPGRNKQQVSTNFGQVAKSQSQQFQNNQVSQFLNPQNQSNINYQNIGSSVNPTKISTTLLSASPDNKLIQSISNNKNNHLLGQQLQQNINKQSTNTLTQTSQNQLQQQGSSSQNNYYKVASQIRRNQLKERRPSMLNSQSTNNTGLLLNKQGSIGSSSQLNINSSVNAGVVSQSNLQQSLIYSQNYGKALPLNEQQKKQYQSQQKESQQQKSYGGIKRQNSSGSQESKNQNIKNQNKRFTVVDKLNEKYTKKLIIDLCNFMNNSNDGNPENSNDTKKEEAVEVIVDKEESVKRTNAFTKQGKGNWSNNSNMNMLDILSQQRVLQRSVSSQKRNVLQSNNNSSGTTPFNNKHGNTSNQQSNHLQTPSKSAQSSGTKRLSFRYNEKPWENTSFNNNSKFNSKYGSFSVMRSINNSQSNWNLNGSQDLNTSNSSIKNGKGKTISNLHTQNQGSSHQILTKDKNAQKGYKKNLSNNFILAGFNESQDINSSRNQNIGSRQKNQGNILDNNILSKNLSNELQVPNANNKFKFANNQNSQSNKPINSTSKQQQLYKQQRGSAHIETSNKSKNSTLLSKDKQYSSPQPTSLANSKNSTKSEIKKSQAISGYQSQHNKNRYSESNNSQQESFEKFQDDEYEIEGKEEEIEDYDEDLQEEDFDDEKEDEEDDLQSQTDDSNSSTSKATFIQNQHTLAPGNYINEQSIHQISHQARLNTNGEGLRPSTMIPVQLYNFESNLEQIPGLQLNIDELKKERQKLIRKITSTFKVKNKALSTSQEYYKILHVIGKGAFAKVCLAIQLLTGKFVAIKLIDKSILRSESAKKRVLQEVQILKMLNNHKHVLKLLEVFESRKLIFIVTEYFRGQDLMKMMKDRNGEPYTENEVRHMLTQILSGLRYVHGNWVLHRDIKLDNLLVDSQLNLKIIDFGISRIIQKDQKMMEQCGTPAFLAPEIIANKGYEGFGSDMWSLGVLIYILLFGKVPFKGNNLVELHKNILNGVLPVDEINEANISYEALSLIQKILKVKVSERINLEGIINSSWMRGYMIPDGIENKELQHKQQQLDMNPEQQDKRSLAQQNQQYDEKIIGYIESFGYSREYVLRCLNKSGLSHVNAIYKVIKNSQIQQANTLYS